MTAYYLLLLGWALVAVIIDAGSKRGARSGRAAFIYVAAASLFLLMSLRATTVGTDLGGYRWQYETQYLRPEEPGYSLLMVICRSLGLDFQKFLAVVSLIIVFSVTALIRQLAASPFLSYFLHVTLGFFAMSLSGLRQSLAVAFTILAFLALVKFRWIVFLAMTLIACSFHNSAVVFFPVLLLSRIRLTRRTMGFLMTLPVAFLVAGQFIDFTQISLPMDRYNTYLESVQVAPNPLAIMVAGAIALVCILVWAPANSTDTSDGRVSERTMSLLVAMSLGNFLVMALSTDVLIFSRLSYYFLPYIAILIPNVIQAARPSWVRAMGPITTAAVAGAQFLITVPGGVLGIDHYAFFWEMM